MIRGILSGAAWGAASSVVVLAVVSVLAEPPVIYSRTAPEIGVPEAAGGTDALQERPEGEPVVPVADAAPQSRAPAAVIAPDVPDTPVLEEAATEQMPIVEVQTDTDMAPLPGQSDAPVLGDAPGAVMPPAAAIEPRQPGADAAPGGDTAPPAALAVAPEEVLPVETAEADVTPEAAPAQETALLPQPGIVTAPEPEAAPESGSSIPDAAPDQAPAIRETVRDLPKVLPRVTTGRLVTIGQDTQPDPVSETDAAEAGSASEAAIDRYARPFENPSARPLVAVILGDVGQPPASQEELKNLPFAVSFAVNAEQPDAGQKMALYRAAGQEVVATATLPDGATPRDVEVSLQGWLNAVPESVALMESGAGVFQGSRSQAQQIVAILAATGHGLLTYRAGLNPAQQVADRDGVPAGQIFRDIDGAGQDRAAIRRFLDQAAFKAGQEGGVIVIGLATPETLAALAEWSLGNRASSVELAPVSAVLLHK